MAILSIDVRTVQRASGRSSVAAAAYRSGTRLEDRRAIATHDYRRRTGVVAAFIVAPDHAPWAHDRATLWNAAEAAETRKDSRLAREYVLALPHELDDAGRRALTARFARHVVDRFGVAADVAVHRPPRTGGDDRNHHAHLLTTSRVVTADGLGAKTRQLDMATTSAALIEDLRRDWAEMTNAALRSAGLSATVDPRSRAEQGLIGAPTVHLGPQATQIERRAQRRDRREGRPYRAVTERGRTNQLILAERAEIIDRAFDAHQHQVLAAETARQERDRRAEEARQAATADQARQAAAAQEDQRMRQRSLDVLARARAARLAAEEAERAGQARERAVEATARPAEPVRTPLVAPPAALQARPQPEAPKAAPVPPKVATAPPAVAEGPLLPPLGRPADRPAPAGPVASPPPPTTRPPAEPGWPWTPAQIPTDQRPIAGAVLKLELSPRRSPGQQRVLEAAWRALGDLAKPFRAWIEMLRSSLRSPELAKDAEGARDRVAGWAPQFADVVDRLRAGGFLSPAGPGPAAGPTGPVRPPRGRGGPER